MSCRGLILITFYCRLVFLALQIVKEINSDSLKLQLDIFHLQLIEGNLTNRIKELLPYIGTVIDFIIVCTII